MSYVNDTEAKLFQHTGDEGQEISFFTIEEIGDLKLPKLLNIFYDQYKDNISKAIENKIYLTASDIGLTN